MTCQCAQTPQTEYDDLLPFKGPALVLGREIAQSAQNYEIEAGTSFFSLDHLSPEEQATLLNFLESGDLGVYLASHPETQITETAFAGVWRLQDTNGVRLEVGQLPQIVLNALHQSKTTALPPRPEDGDPMALSTLSELVEQCEKWAEGHPVEGIDLGQAPYPEAAQREIIEWLEDGGIRFEESGSFPATVRLTRLYPVWFSTYRNTAGKPRVVTLTLNEIPEVIVPPSEDIRKAGTRLASLLS